MNVLVALIILIQLLQWLVIAHVVMSFLPIFGIKMKISFINDLLDPVYKTIENTIPTTIAGLSFTPIIILIILQFFR
jgi:uncharacterized protein YggT (Ycf19 family)